MLEYQSHYWTHYVTTEGNADADLPLEFFTNTESWHVAILANFVFHHISSFCLYLHQLMLVEVNLKIKGIWDYILQLYATLDSLNFNNRAKMKLATLAFLYCGGIVKNSIVEAGETKTCDGNFLLGTKIPILCLMLCESFLFKLALISE